MIGMMRFCNGEATPHWPLQFFTVLNTQQSIIWHSLQNPHYKYQLLGPILPHLNTPLSALDSDFPSLHSDVNYTSPCCQSCTHNGQLLHTYPNWNLKASTHNTQLCKSLNTQVRWAICNQENCSIKGPWAPALFGEHWTMENNNQRRRGVRVRGGRGGGWGGGRGGQGRGRVGQGGQGGGRVGQGGQEEGRGGERRRRAIISNQIQATIVDHVLNHGLSIREAGLRVQPNLSRFTVARIIRTFRVENRY